MNTINKVIDSIKEVKEKIYFSIILTLFILGYLSIFIGIFILNLIDEVKLILEIILCITFIIILSKNIELDNLDNDYEFILDFFSIIDDLSSLITFSYALVSTVLIEESFSLDKFIPFILFMITIKILNVLYRYKYVKEKNKI